MPEVFFSFVISDSSRPSRESEGRSALANREHFILDISRIDLWNQGTFSHVYARRKRLLKI